MSIDDSGLDGKISRGEIVIAVKDSHPLIQLAQALQWDRMAESVLPDLKSTPRKGRWWLGRPLHLRIHLGAYIVQQIFNKTDRQTEYDIKDNAVYQLFCGRYLVKKWHYPDHTKIEEFRSRLRPETQEQLANSIAVLAAKSGYADPAHIDIDSTVQEANMTYPTDSSLLCKLGSMAKKISGYMNRKLSVFAIKPMEVNLKRIRSMARRYFFLKKTATQEEKHNKLKMLLECVSEEVGQVVRNARCMGDNFIQKMPWNIKKVFCRLIEKTEKYGDVRYFVENGGMASGKILSFHLDDPCCFNKKKLEKSSSLAGYFSLPE